MDSNGDHRPDSNRLSEGEPSVLANLPSTRPQRPSTRRTAARQAAKARTEQPAGNGTKPVAGSPHSEQAAKAGAGQSTNAGAGRGAKGRTKPTGKTSREPTTRRLRLDEPPAPPQGFDAEGGIEPGVSVQPPNGVELATSAVELVGDLAQSGLAGGGRLLKSALARLPGL
jgi:hypothetical protein